MNDYNNIKANYNSVIYEEYQFSLLIYSLRHFWWAYRIELRLNDF